MKEDRALLPDRLHEARVRMTSVLGFMTKVPLQLPHALRLEQLLALAYLSRKYFGITKKTLRTTRRQTEVIFPVW